MNNCLLFLGNEEQWDLIYTVLVNEQKARLTNSHYDMRYKWETRDHEIMFVYQMKDSHIQNSINYMRRNADRVGWFKKLQEDFLETL